jgi:hypothetical protein
MDGDNRPLGKDIQLRIGHHRRHFQNSVNKRIKSGHFQINPHQIVVVFRQTLTSLTLFIRNDFFALLDHSLISSSTFFLAKDADKGRRPVFADWVTVFLGGNSAVHVLSVGGCLLPVAACHAGRVERFRP